MGDLFKDDKRSGNGSNVYLAIDVSIIIVPEEKKKTDLNICDFCK